jgi:hypothetical protein
LRREGGVNNRNQQDLLLILNNGGLLSQVDTNLEIGYERLLLENPNNQNRTQRTNIEMEEFDDKLKQISSQTDTLIDIFFFFLKIMMN